MSTNNRNQGIIDEFRANKGKVGGRYEGKTLLLLHTTGAKSNNPHINPAAYVKDGDHYVVIASMGGAPTNPDWYYNIVAHPSVTVEAGTEKFQAEAKVIKDDPERTRLYNKMADMMPSFNDYRQKTSRVIPVIVLERKQ